MRSPGWAENGEIRIVGQQRFDTADMIAMMMGDQNSYRADIFGL